MKKYLSNFLSLMLLGSILLLCGIGVSCQPASQEAPPATGAETTLNLYGIDPFTLDPALSSEMTSHSYITQIFGGLVRLDENLKPVPDIAREFKVSDDGMTYTFYLRDDVKFQDGRKVTTADFKYSWERACDPATNSVTAAAYLGDIVGAKKMLSGESKGLSGVKVLDEHTLQVTIDAPKSYFLSKLTYPTAYVVDKKNVAAGGEWWRHPNGTGPFKLAQWQERSLFVLERNPLYYGKLAGVKQVVYQLYGGIPMNLYETGKIDVTGVSLVYIDKITDEAGPFHQDLRVYPELSFYYIGFNTAKPPFDDANVRLAFCHAVDKKKLAFLVFRDMLQPADGILPPGMLGYNENLVGLEYDIEKAKELIKNSKYGDVSHLPPITITDAGEGGGVSSDLESIIYEWQQNLGVEVKVRQLETERFIYHLKEEADEMFYTGWIADYPHPQDFLDILFHSDADNNYGGYSNPDVDTLLEMAAVESDSDLSLVLYQQAEQMLVDDAACIPLWFGKNYMLVKPYVKGFEFNPVGFAMLNRVTVEPD